MQLEFIKPVTWEEVFKEWEESESTLPHWVEHYEKRGFSSWKEWRMDSFKALPLEKLTWNLYKIPNQRMVLEFHGGPFRVWMNKYYGHERMLSFHELAKNPELRNDRNKMEIIEKFPKEATFIGLLNNGRVVLMDGMHRACALAIALEKGIRIDTELYIFLAEFNDEIPVMGQPNSIT